MIICAECQKEFEDDEGLHRHLRSHGLVKEGYYQKHHGRKDLLTGELLPFKNKEDYFNRLFSTRGNCIKYIQQLPKDQQGDFVYKLFEERAKLKNLLYLPCDVELRSSILPSVTLLKKLGIDYNELGKDLDLVRKYNYDTSSITFKKEKLDIIIDSREQKELFFSDHNVIKSTLSFGDYTCRNSFNNIFIERKSLVDFISTFGNQVERFEREVLRAQSINATLIVLVENKLSDALSFNYIPYIAKRTKLTPDYVFHNIRYLIQTYPNLQFCFCENRKAMTKAIENIYQMSPRVNRFDIQYLYDKGLLTI